MLAAEELYDRGVALVNTGHHAAAKRILASASQRAEHPDLAARIDGTTSYLLLENGEVDEAEALCRKALRRRDLTAATRAVLRGQEGLIALHRGELHRALRLFGVALSGLGDAPVMAGRVAMNRGNTLLELGRTSEARTDFGTAARLLHAAGLPNDAAKALHNQEYASLLEGDLVSAFRLMEAARARASAASPADAAVGDVDRAEALVAAGMPFEASAALAEATAVYRARRLRLRQADATWRRARTLLYVDPANAARLALAASRLFESHGNRAGALRCRAIALRAAVAGGGRSRQLLDQLDDVAAQLARVELRDDARDLRLLAKRVRVRRGGADVAREALRSVRIARDAPIARRVLAHEVRAEAATALSDDAQVMREAARGLRELAEWQSVFGSIDLQTSLAMHGQALTQAGIAAALRSGSVGNMFEWSERARNVTSLVVTPRPSSDARTAADLAELRRMRVSASPGPPGDRREAELRARIRTRQWGSNGSGLVATIARLDEVRAALDERTVLVAYLWSGERFVAVVVDRHDARALELGEARFEPAERSALFADLDVQAARPPGAMGAAVARSLEQRLARVDDLFVAPVLAASDLAASAASRVVIVAPGRLAGIPWGMLRSLAGHPVTVPLSATRWAAERGAHGVGSARDASAGFVVGPRVPRAFDEARRAAIAWQDHAVVLDGHAADAGAASELAATVDVFHVIGHGRHAVDNPYFSGVELADGPWFGYDIDGIARMPRTVVMSACELGRSSVGWGHEALGMARAWLHAGAASVIASPATVNDDDACELLAALHAELAVGAAPAVALAAATAHTGIRASFLCYGAGW